MKYSIENPLVSILMPARDAEEFIAEAITSALHQRYSNLEVLVAVDSSSDQTEHIVRQLGRMDSRVRLIEAGSIGFPHVRDLLLEAAEGEFIAILDADDVCQPERIGTQVDFLRRHPDIDVVGAHCETIDRLGRTSGAVTPPETHEAIAAALRHRNVMVHSSVMFRASLRRFELRYVGAPVEDYVFFLQLLARGSRFANIPSKLVRYRVHDSSLTSSDHCGLANRLNALACYQVELERGPQPTEVLAEIMASDGIVTSLHHSRAHELHAWWHRKSAPPKNLSDFRASWRYAFCPHFQPGYFGETRFAAEGRRILNGVLRRLILTPLIVVGRSIVALGAERLCPCGIATKTPYEGADSI